MKHRFFVTGDTHGNIRRFSAKNFPQGKELTKDDIVFICGDFGMIWSAKETGEEEYWLDWLNEKPWVTLVVLGNHENYEAIKNNYQKMRISIDGDYFKVYYVRDSVFIIERGEAFSIGDKTFFCFGGATSIDKPLRTIGISWWPDEEPTYKDFENALDNLKKKKSKVDYIISHDIPFGLYNRIVTSGTISATSNFLDEVYQNTTFKKWYAGHHHLDKDIENDLRIVYYDIIEIE